MQVLPFLAVAVVVLVTPGIDTALVTRNALPYGHRAAVATAVGVNVGIGGVVAARLALLGALFNLIGVVWLLSYAVAAARGRAVLSRPRVKRVLDRVSGMVLVGLGARLALEHRR